MIRQITDDGYLKFDTVGAIDRRVLLGKPVLVGPKRVPGVVGLKAYHLVSREEEKSWTLEDLDRFSYEQRADSPCPFCTNHCRRTIVKFPTEIPG